MRTGEPSRTAWAAAFHRAAHQVLEQGRIFQDPLALRFLGKDAETVAREAEERPFSRRMQIFIAVRHRFAEDAIEASVEGGVRQVVVLGAGLDTWAYRTPIANRIRIFEVDRPQTQLWKRERLNTAGIALPDSLTFAPVDFERQTLSEGLGAGFNCREQTFFTWLGVVPYLTPEAMWSTLAFIASLPNGAHVVFDYGDPPDSLSPEMRAAHDQRAARVSAVGEPWLNYFTAEDLRAKLISLGFSEIEDLGPPEIASRFFPNRAASIPKRGGHIVHAAAPGLIDPLRKSGPGASSFQSCPDSPR